MGHNCDDFVILFVLFEQFFNFVGPFSHIFWGFMHIFTMHKIHNAFSFLMIILTVYLLQKLEILLLIFK